MFSMDAGKPRKLTTYGKAGRQQSSGFNKFLDASPEKRKSQATSDASQSNVPFRSTKDRPRTSDVGWDVPSDLDEPEHRAQPTNKWRHATNSVFHKLKPAGGGMNQAKEKGQGASRIKHTTKKSEGDVRINKRRVKPPNDHVQTSAPKDVFDFPNDDYEAVPAPLSLPTRSRGKTPTLISARSTTTNQPQSLHRRHTPEPLSPQRVSTAKRNSKHGLDVYDFPDDDDQMTSKRSAHGVAASPFQAHKRQKTPAAEARNEGTVTPKSRSRATTPSRSRANLLSDSFSAKRRTMASPKLGTNRVVKRRVEKGASAPASLFSMIREPPSPPADSSDNVTNPGSPDVTFEMDIEPATTPATPPNRGSASPAALPGSVMPRQKMLWSQLLGDDSTDSPSELPISSLRLTSTIKPASQKLASLTRSASDIPQSTTNRRSRLIDSLKATTPIAEVDEMDVDEAMGRSEKQPSGHEFAGSSGSKPAKLRREVSYKNTSTKVTYGQGRTYLEEKNEERLWDMLAAEEASNDFSVGGSQSQGIVDDDTDMDGGSQLRAAHDLRAAGSRKRLHDELSMLLMDVEEKTNSVAIRRSALRDLAAKLTDNEAASCFIETGLDRGFLKAVEQDTDTVFLFFEAAVVVLLAAADPTSSILDHVFHSRMFSNIFKLLELNTSLEKVLRDRKSNLSKMTQAMILESRDTLFEAEAWGQSKPRSLTPQVLGLKCIEMVVRKLREHGSSSTLLDEATVKKILNITQRELADESPDMIIVELGLSALQVNTVSTPTLRHKIWPPSLIQAFTDLLPGLLASNDAAAALSMHLALKLAVELTNHNTAACDTIGTPAVIEPLLSSANKSYALLLNHQVGEAYSVAFDFTVLCFGLTINLTEASDKARLAMLEGRGQHLQDSIKLFIRAKKHADDAESLEDTQMNVIYGCLAFTLGNLSRNSTVRDVVKRQLPGGNLDMVLDAMQEFAAINQLTDKKEFEGEEGDEVSRGFTQRLQTVLDEVRAVNM